MDLQPWYNLTTTRKIQILQGEDILRWGKSSQVIFDMHEAYTIKVAYHPIPHNNIWKKIWSTKHWPKTSTFLWLMTHKIILTWDNIIKQGFIGPSICPLFLGEVDSQNNLLNLCFYSSQVWDQCAIVMCITDFKREGLREIIEEWREKTFHSPILNHIWQLLFGFTLWKLWKEWNRHIFLTTHQDWQTIWTQIHSNIIETINLQPWKETNLKCPTHEQSILDSWNVTPNPFLNKNP
jgi:hypothetical protein